MLWREGCSLMHMSITVVHVNMHAPVAHRISSQHRTLRTRQWTHPNLDMKKGSKGCLLLKARVSHTLLIPSPVPNPFSHITSYTSLSLCIIVFNLAFLLTICIWTLFKNSSSHPYCRCFWPSSTMSLCVIVRAVSLSVGAQQHASVLSVLPWFLLNVYLPYWILS